MFFTQDDADATREADAVFMSVGTPLRHGDGRADLSYVHAAEEIAGLPRLHLRRDQVDGARRDGRRG